MCRRSEEVCEDHRILNMFKKNATSIIQGHLNKSKYSTTPAGVAVGPPHLSVSLPLCLSDFLASLPNLHQEMARDLGLSLA